MIILIIIDIDKQGQNGTTIFNILDNTTELWMTKYVIGEIFSSGGATLYKKPSDQTVPGVIVDLGVVVDTGAVVVVDPPGLGLSPQSTA